MKWMQNSGHRIVALEANGLKFHCNNMENSSTVGADWAKKVL